MLKLRATTDWTFALKNALLTFGFTLRSKVSFSFWPLEAFEPLTTPLSCSAQTFEQKSSKILRLRPFKSRSCSTASKGRCATISSALGLEMNLDKLSTGSWRQKWGSFIVLLSVEECLCAGMISLSKRFWNWRESFTVKCFSVFGCWPGTFRGD